MAPFPDSSLSKVFLSLYLMNLSHPFSPRWSQGQMEEREHTPLQRFISPLSPVSLLLPTAFGVPQQVMSYEEEIPTFWAPSQLAMVSLPICSYREPSPPPQEWERDAFLQLFPPSLTMGAKPPRRLCPAFRATPLTGRGGKCPKWRTAFVPGLALPRCSPRNVFHRSVPGAGRRRGRDATEQGASRHMPEAGW